MKEILIQSMGGIALIFWALSILNKKKIKILRLQNIANIFYAIEYFFLGAFSALGMNLLSSVRGIIFVNNEKKQKENSNILIIIFSIITLIIGIATYNNWYSIIPIINTLGYSYSTWQKNTKVIRLIFLIAAILWIVYNLLVGAYIPMIGNIIEVISALIAIIKFDILKKENNSNK